MRLLKKVSVSTVFGKLKKEDIEKLKDNGGEIYVGRFYGLASGFKTGSTQFGLWTGLTGSFRAVDAGTGELCQGPVLLLPMGICEQVAEIIKEKEGTGEIVQIAIAVDIFVKYRSIGGEDKYEYVARSNEVPKQEDPLELLQKSLGELPKLALAAPTEAPAVTEAVAEPEKVANAVESEKPAKNTKKAG